MPYLIQFWNSKMFNLSSPPLNLIQNVSTNYRYAKMPRLIGRLTLKVFSLTNMLFGPRQVEASTGDKITKNYGQRIDNWL